MKRRTCKLRTNRCWEFGPTSWTNSSKIDGWFMIVPCHEVRAEKKNLLTTSVFVGYWMVLVLEAQFVYNVVRQLLRLEVKNLKFAKPGTGDSFWKSTCSGSKWSFLGVAIMDTSVVCWLQTCFLSGGGDYFRYHQLRKIKMEEIMRPNETTRGNKLNKGPILLEPWTSDQSSSCHRHVGRRIRREDSAVGGCVKGPLGSSKQCKVVLSTFELIGGVFVVA